MTPAARIINLWSAEVVKRGMAPICLLAWDPSHRAGCLGATSILRGLSAESRAALRLALHDAIDKLFMYLENSQNGVEKVNTDESSVS